jgi:hypothetical protein
MPRPQKVPLQTVKITHEGLRLLRIIAASSDEFLHQTLERLLRKEVAQIKRKGQL